MCETLFAPGPARLSLEVPVRHGKSLLCSTVLPPWYLAHHPDRRVILGGYGTSFAAEFGGAALKIFKEVTGPLFGLAVEKETAAYWTIKGHKGSMRSTGTGGAITGTGADVLILDDLVKDQQDAASETVRASTWRWLMADCFSRLEPDGKVIMIMSRRHPDDVVGMVQQSEDAGSTPWRRVRLPALAEADDPLGRKPGEALFPERYDEAALARVQNDLEIAGEGHLFDCLYQQDPRGDPSLTDWGPEYFKGVVYDQLPPDLPVAMRLVSIDPSAGKNAKTGDYGAILYGIVTVDGHYWIDDAVMRRLPIDQLEDAAVGVITARAPHAAIVEANGFQEKIANDIAKRCPGVLFVNHVNETDKEVRIRTGLSPLLREKKLHLHNSPASQIILSQMKSFPTAAHDDGPDAVELMTQLVHFVSGGRRQPPRRVLR